MANFRNRLLRNAIVGALAAGGLATVPASAQTEAVAPSAEAERRGEPVEQIVVTGSRLRRDTFTSISPLQVVDAGQARLVGLVDAGAMIADAPSVTGEQFDGSVVAGSPTAAVEGLSPTGLGGQAVALRGLGPERTLLLVNGRRLAPSGVRGAPVAPDLNLIPATMIDRIEILTDGASSIYGADAVAGVANVILRQDVEGLEFTAFQSVPERSGGETTQFGLIGGASNDRGNFTIAMEYFNRSPVLVGDRKNFNDCLRDIQVGTDGKKYSTCLDNRPANSAFLLGAGGFAFYEPGMQSPGLPPNWVRNADLLAAGTNFRLTDRFTLQDSEREGNLYEELERSNIFATGHQDLNLFSRDTFYFELSYAQRNSTGRFPREQVFPGIKGFIPMEDANGNLMVDGNGAPLLFPNPLNPFGEDALPVITLQDFPQRRSSELSNSRFVFGLEGDLAFGGLQARNWIYDGYVSYDRSFGTSRQPVMIDPHIRESLDTLRFNADGELICGVPRGALDFGFVNVPPCVVVDFFSPTLYTAAGGDGTFATQEEADYLFGSSITSTEIEQSHVSLVTTGELFQMAAGSVGLVLGAEFREQRIRSLTDVVRSQGLASSEVPDVEGDTIGRTSLWEVFAETEFPITQQFTLNLSGRYTSEENFGSEFTYSAKAAFAPTDALRFRATYGTTFRAPNLREQFLAGAAGTIAGGLDPCRVPDTARDANNNYDPNADTRPQAVLDNCVAAGADPTALGLLATTGIPTTTGGNPDAQAETSDSWTLGFVFLQPWSDRYDFALSLTYFDIEIENTLRESNPASILAQCYNGPVPLQDATCDRITRNLGDPTTATISNVDAAFINIGKLTSKGFDINASFSMPVNVLGRGSDLTLSTTVTRQQEQKEQVDDDSPSRDFAGTIALPKWRGNVTASLGTGNWSTLWRARYIGGGRSLDGEDFGPFSAVASACGVLGVNPAEVQCRRVDFTPSYIQHDLSVSYNRDVWSATLGVVNVLDRSPPLIDQGRGPARMNIVVQSGHDLIGRRAFLNLTRRF
jgi:iron complex outermembrane recepter protein